MRRIVLIALFGAVAGQAVVWYTGQFYALFFLEKTLKVDGATANILIAIALALATPFFVFFGWLSDRIGRKPIILAGCALAALTYFPLFEGLTRAANPALYEAQRQAPVEVMADSRVCSVQFDPIGRTSFNRNGCDIAKSLLAKAGIGYESVDTEFGTGARLKIGDAFVDIPNAPSTDEPEAHARWAAAAEAEVKAALARAGYPSKADPARVNKPLVVAILFLLVLYVTMVYGPIAALAGRAVPEPDPLQLDVAALPYRQRLVRRLPSDHRLRHGRGDGGYLLRPLVPDRDRGADPDRRAVPASGDPRAGGGVSRHPGEGWGPVTTELARLGPGLRWDDGACLAPPLPLRRRNDPSRPSSSACACPRSARPCSSSPTPTSSSPSARRGSSAPSRR